MAADHSKVDRIVDIASVALISAAAVLSAICSYQAGRWSGEQARLYNVANAQHVASSEITNRRLALTAIDVNLFLNYVAAMGGNDRSRATFIYKRFPPDLRRAVAAWIATKPLTNPKAPSSPFVMPGFEQELDTGSRKDEAIATASFSAALVATHHSDRFMLLTVIFAAVSFLAGVSTKLQFPRHAIIVALGTAALLYGIVRLVGLPFL